MDRGGTVRSAAAAQARRVRPAGAAPEPPAAHMWRVRHVHFPFLFPYDQQEKKKSTSEREKDSCLRARGGWRARRRRGFLARIAHLQPQRFRLCAVTDQLLPYLYGLIR